MQNLPLFRVDPVLRITALCSAFLDVKPVGYYYKGESHNFSEAVFVLNGTIKATAGDNVYEITSGNMILHPPGEFHRIINEGDSSVSIGIVSFKDEIVYFDKHIICSFEDSREIVSAINNIRETFEMNGIFVVGVDRTHTQSDAQIAVGEFERLLLRTMKVTNLCFDETKQDRLSQLYSTVISVMRSDIGKRMSSNEIADACGMSVSTMQKLFSRYTGIGVMKYYERLRMEHAKELLEKGYMVKQVAISLGYTDQNYFSVAYKRHFGISPSKDKL